MKQFAVIRACDLPSTVYTDIHEAIAIAAEYSKPIHGSLLATDFTVVQIVECPAIVPSVEFNGSDVFTDPDRAFEDLLADIESAKLSRNSTLATALPDLHKSALSLLDFTLTEPDDLAFPALSDEELFAWWNSSPESMSPENHWRVQCWRAETGKMSVGEFADWQQAKFTEDNIDRN